jgi:hypothetical protein
MMVAHGYWTAVKIVRLHFEVSSIELEIKDDAACGTYGLEQCYMVLVGKYEGIGRLGWGIILK